MNRIRIYESLSIGNGLPLSDFSTMSTLSHSVIKKYFCGRREIRTLGTVTYGSLANCWFKPSHPSFQIKCVADEVRLELTRQRLTDLMVFRTILLANLSTHPFIFLLSRRDLDPRPFGYQPNALTN